MNKAEQKFRESLSNNEALKVEWATTWHEDREISPGVPDMHYVMKGQPGEEFRVGWIELKAIETNITASQHIKVEPSQHQYIRRWSPLMPIHFMVRIKSWVHLIPGAYHRELASATCLADIAAISVLTFDQSQIAAVLPPYLRQITKI
jgi:hypothetical protein